MDRLTTGSGQLRWVVLLLAVAVILPTVCLLWFMSEVVRNERLAVQQKLINIYRERLTRAARQVNDLWLRNCKFLDTQDPDSHPYQILAAVIRNKFCDGLLVYDSAGACLYPRSTTESDTHVQFSAVFNEVRQLEFVEHDYAKAAELYDQIAGNLSGFTRLTAFIRKTRGFSSVEDSNDLTRMAALIGKSRCQEKLGLLEDAVETCKQVASSPLEKRADSAVLTLIADARLLMLKIVQGNRQYRSLYRETYQKLVSMLYRPDEAGFSLRADKNLFIAQRALAILQQDSSLKQIAGLQPLLDRLTKFVSCEEMSLQVAEMLSFRSEPVHELQKLMLGGRTLYSCVHRTGQRTFLVLLSPETLRSMLTDYEVNLADSSVDYRLVDDSGGYVAGVEQPKIEPLATEPVSRWLPGWKVQLYFKSDTFEKAASERIALYIWTSVLVISLILLSGAFAAKAIVSQVRLNRLKNDFIATVTHELKTPLASMRVLVDTLLEGHYRNEQQVVDYLQLISSENIRLSRLIDNFLTFSRMERNKKAFQLIETDPGRIAHAAVEAVRTKLSNGRCRLKVDIQHDLPAIVADQDAMITVLVNLLDNAYKYSYEDKDIELKVFAANGFVEFSVSDNGIGLSRRSVKKIFTKFYQVDRSLSRRTGGCGLGLSIAKFIVDAHKGSISVESRLSQGSTFTVRLPSTKHV